MAHGSKYHRHAGSNGSATTPGRVFKGKHMPGHMGAVRVTVQNLEVVSVDAEKNLILVKGAVPGTKEIFSNAERISKSCNWFEKGGHYRWQQLSVYNIEGNQVGEIELNDAVFGVEVNENLMHKAVVAQLAASRQGTQSAKTRSEVSGGGRKPWRQKGTGHARQGSTRSPQWTGGGVVFAPKPRDYSIKIKQERKKTGY